MVWGWFEHITFIVHFISIVITSAPPWLSGIRSQSFWTSALEQSHLFLSNFAVCLFSFQLGLVFTILYFLCFLEDACYSLSVFSGICFLNNLACQSSQIFCLSQRYSQKTKSLLKLKTQKMLFFILYHFFLETISRETRTSKGLLGRKKYSSIWILFQNIIPSQMSTA